MIRKSSFKKYFWDIHILDAPMMRALMPRGWGSSTGWVAAVSNRKFRILLNSNTWRSRPQLEWCFNTEGRYCRQEDAVPSWCSDRGKKPQQKSYLWKWRCSRLALSCQLTDLPSPYFCRLNLGYCQPKFPKFVQNTDAVGWWTASHRLQRHCWSSWAVVAFHQHQIRWGSCRSDQMEHVCLCTSSQVERCLHFSSFQVSYCFTVATTHKMCCGKSHGYQWFKFNST